MKLQQVLIALSLFTLNELALAKKNNNDDDGSSSGGSHYSGSNNDDNTDTDTSGSGTGTDTDSGSDSNTGGSGSESSTGGSSGSGSGSGSGSDDSSNSGDDGSSSSSGGGSSHYGGSDDGACVDTYYQCASYVSNGYCPTYFCSTCAYAGYCDLSCDFCPVPSPTAAPIIAPTVAVASNGNNDDYDYSEQCFTNACGCPNSWAQGQTTCTISNALVDSSWCQKKSKNCEDSCDGTWCDGTESVPIPATTPNPIPSPTQHPIHAPTRHPVIDPIPSPTSSPIPRPTAHPIPSPTASPIVTHDGGRTCFSSEDMVTLENGEKLPFAKLSVGDKILTASRDGTIAYSKVVFLPHKENFTPTTFLKFTTERNKEIKLTSNHLVQLCSGRLLAAHLLTLDAKADSCLRTIHGDEQITAIEQVQSNGVYTAVAENEFLVVNGIIASPFAQSAVLAHAFFNITDMEDWCSSHNWMVYENLHHQPLLDVMNAHDTLVTPSEDCMNLLTNMFKKFKHEPVGWGVNGWGYRGWANPASAQKSAHVHSSNQHRNLRLSEAKLQEEAEQVPLAGILSGWD